MPRIRHARPSSEIKAGWRGYSEGAFHLDNERINIYQMELAFVAWVKNLLEEEVARASAGCDGLAQAACVEENQKVNERD